MAASAIKRALVIAAPSSGSGKTLVTLALLRAFKQAGVGVCAAKAGPDYIDPAFHGLACGSASVNLDPWAMKRERIQNLAYGQEGDLLLVEAMMGLFDGAADGTGSAADLAVTLNAPIVLVVDAAKQSHSIAALAGGFAKHREDVHVAGVILNKVGSSRHEAILRAALDSINMPVFGVVYRNDELMLPERHLGLVQAGEQNNIGDFIYNAADIVGGSCDMEAINDCAANLSVGRFAACIAPLGQKIAIAKDEAFSFIYPHLLSDWRESGAEITFFSPLLNEAPSLDCDAIYLPGGYPELNCAQIAEADVFHKGMKSAADKDTIIYGECGGYMVLGEGIEDKHGTNHKMLGLLKLETSFAKRKLHLGYRKIEALGAFNLGEKFAAHEFHYTSATKEEGEPLFMARDALDAKLGNAGLKSGNVMGSYMHIIDGAE